MATIADMAFIQGRLIALYPNYRPADLALVNTIWLEILGDLPADLCKLAVMQYAGENHDFAPSAGTVRAYAFKIQTKAAGIPDGYHAYREVCDMPANMTRQRIVEPDGGNGWATIETTKMKWSHPLIEQIAAAIGWPRTFPTDNPTADRAQFLKAWDALVEKHVTDAARLPVVEKYIEQSGNKILPGIQEVTKRLEAK